MHSLAAPMPPADLHRSSAANPAAQDDKVQKCYTHPFAAGGRSCAAFFSLFSFLL